MALDPNEPFELEKYVWSELDYERMGWHDVHIHAVAFRTEKYELLLDIDYMFAWVNPEPPEKHYSFWMAPCTLIFSNVHSFTADIEWGLGLEISNVSREVAGRPRNSDFIKKDIEWKWIFECQEGTFTFLSVGYEQIVRAKPRRVKSQVFSWEDRGDVSFSRRFPTTDL